MVLTDHISLEMFCEEIISFSLNEFTKVWDGCEPLPTETLPYFQHVGKAVALFGMMHQRKVAYILSKVQSRLLSSSKTFDEFVNNFADNYFQSLDSLPRQYFLIAILAFCGVVAAMADFWFYRGHIELAQACVDNLQMELEMCVEELHSLGSWEGLFEAATSFAELYETGAWTKSTRETEFFLMQCEDD